jgi:hypothetical protein
VSSLAGRWMLLLGLLASPSICRGQLPPRPNVDGHMDRMLLERLQPVARQPHHHFDDEPDGDPFALIQQRLAELEKKGKAHKELQELYQQLLKDPELLNRDPDKRKRLEELIKDSGVTLDPNDPRIKRLQEWLKNRPPGSSKTPPLSPEAQEELKRLLDAFKNQPPSTNPNPLPIPDKAPEPICGEPPDPAMVIDDAERAARRDFMDWLLRQSRKLDDGRFRDSDLARQLRNDLTRFASNGTFRDGKRWAADTRLGQKFSDLTKDLRSMRMFSDVKLPMPNVNLPRPTMPGLPNMGGWGQPPSIGSLPGLGTPSMPSAQTFSGDFFLWLAAVGVAALIGWRLYKLYGPFGRRDPASALVDLPWPTAPGAVATRADLVRAFEFLSLALLGRESRTWNHLDVAAKLGGDAIERRQAADTLAGLYEQARYAPADEPLSAEDFTAAQQSLTTLRGGAAS